MSADADDEPREVKLIGCLCEESRMLRRENAALRREIAAMREVQIQPPWWEEIGDAVGRPVAHWTDALRAIRDLRRRAEAKP